VKTLLTARLRHTDAAGVVYFARYFELAHEAYEQALAEGGMPLTPEVLSAGVLLPIVHAEADYAAPLHLGDEVEVTLSVEDVRERLFTLVFEFQRAGVRVCRVRTVHVAVRREDFTATSLPEGVREIVSRWPRCR